MADLDEASLDEHGTRGVGRGPLLSRDANLTGPEAADVVDIEAPVADNIAAVAKAKGKFRKGLTKSKDAAAAGMLDFDSPFIYGENS